jgi:outer membrane protein assembly factor BamB
MLRLIAIGTLTIHTFLSSTVLTAQIATLQGDWPQFRGPLRDGVSADTGLLTKWPKGGPPLVWDTRGAGRGYASLSLVEGRMFTLGDGPSTAPDTDEYVSCFDRATGEQLWLKRLGPAWTSGRPDWQSSRSTPTIDGDLLYVLTPHGKLVCLKVNTGEPVWEMSLKDDFGGKKGDGWGYSESVLIDGDRLVCTPGGSQSTIVALDKKTGERIWTAVRADDRGAGHASIVVSEVGGVRIYVQTTAGGALGVRAEDGELLWSYPIESHCCSTPSVHDGLVYVGDCRGNLHCVDAATGEPYWVHDVGNQIWSSTLVADGKIYIGTRRGDFQVLATGKEKQLLSAIRLDAPVISTAVAADGMLYVASMTRLFALKAGARAKVAQ